MMRHGTEVEIVRADEQGDDVIAVELVGARCFQLIGDPWLQELGKEEEPAPAPLAEVAAATQDTSKFIVSRVEYAKDTNEGGSLRSDAVEELGADSEKILDDLVGDADKEANRQLASGMLRARLNPFKV
jgi:Lon protease-like protein